jgi:hypothetical protein
LIADPIDIAVGKNLGRPAVFSAWLWEDTPTDIAAVVPRPSCLTNFLGPSYKPKAKPLKNNHQSMVVVTPAGQQS